MSNLFSLPRVRSLPAAKLYFRQSGTSTPQNTYTGVDLTTPHANPVVADSEGYFAPIYLDPSLPDYRVIHTAGGNVDNDPTLEVALEPTLDGVPSSANLSRGYRAKGTEPAIIFEETDASSNNKKWRIRVNTAVFSIETGNDAESSWTSILSIDRDGVIAQTGTFVGTFTGMTETTTNVISYRVALGFVTLVIDEDLLTFGTSDTTAMTITGLPEAIIPTIESAHPCILTDNGVEIGGWAVISSLGVITLGVGFDNDTAGFTNSGLKGVPSKWSITYPL